MSEMPFFGFGTFAEGLLHFDKIKEFVLSIQEAYAVGTAYRLKVGFPVFSEQGNHHVQGSLLKLKVNDLLLGLLDQYHGVNPTSPEKSLHYRKQISVKTQFQESLAWAYVVNENFLPKDSELIPDGNWLQSLKSSPALPMQLTEKQKLYVTKLGSASGREIVPINDLSLYRELMKLELIVDKGRRLALSKLGHEVYRYLV